MTPPSGGVAAGDDRVGSSDGYRQGGRQAVLSEDDVKLYLSERVRHDSVSAIAFRFQAHHLYHIFVQEFGPGAT